MNCSFSCLTVLHQSGALSPSSRNASYEADRRLRTFRLSVLRSTLHASRSEFRQIDAQRIHDSMRLRTLASGVGVGGVGVLALHFISSWASDGGGVCFRHRSRVAPEANGVEPFSPACSVGLGRHYGGRRLTESDRGPMKTRLLLVTSVFQNPILTHSHIGTAPHRDVAFKTQCEIKDKVRHYLGLGRPLDTLFVPNAAN